MSTHEHSYLGQRLRHSHQGGDQEHGYYEHPEDGFPYPAELVTEPAAEARPDFDPAMARHRLAQARERLQHYPRAARDPQLASVLSGLEEELDGAAYFDGSGMTSRGTCARCGTLDRDLPGVLSADPEAGVCAACHADPLVPTFPLTALFDERPVYVLARGDVARLAGCELSDEEISRISSSIEFSTVPDAVRDAVVMVIDLPGDEDEEDNEDPEDAEFDVEDYDEARRREEEPFRS
jgi:hypothetical protein